MRPLAEVAADLGLSAGQVLPWGPGRAKIPLEALDRPMRGRLLLVTAMSPSPAGEGKTTVAIGLADALARAGHRAAVALRQPSMGPVFGTKGGGTGGGRARVVPEEALNLHFTGDFHAVTAAHNLLSAALDAHLHHGNALGLDVRRVIWHRVQDVNDRALRSLVVGLGGVTGGVPREERFDITAASEVMAVLALASGHGDLRQRLGRMVVGFDRGDRPVTADDLQCAGAMAALLRDALLPNMVQTLEGTPALVHAGPFANLAHGTSSVLASRAGLQGADFLVQEAGFGADLGGEKFVDLFCPVLGVQPACAVVVVSLRACRFQGGGPAEPGRPPGASGAPAALEAGLANALHHLASMASLGLPVVAAVNEFSGDPPEELDLVTRVLESQGFPAVRVRVHQEGGAGAGDLARWVVSTPPGKVRPLQETGLSLEEKLEQVAVRMYGAEGVHLESGAARQLEECRRHGMGEAGVCVARTPYSLTEDPARVGRPTGFRLRVREVYMLAGAGFVVPLCGEIMTMPGLGRSPRLQRVEVEEDGTIRLG